MYRGLRITWRVRNHAICNLQEAAYNMARAAQQLGLMHLAVPLYERALAYVLA